MYWMIRCRRRGRKYNLYKKDNYLGRGNQQIGRVFKLREDNHLRTRREKQNDLKNLDSHQDKEQDPYNE